MATFVLDRCPAGVCVHLERTFEWRGVLCPEVLVYI